MMPFPLADDRKPIKLEIDLSRMIIRIGVLPSALSIESSRAWAEMAIPDFQDAAANITIGVNAHVRELAADFARNRGYQAPRGTSGT